VTASDAVPTCPAVTRLAWRSRRRQPARRPAPCPTATRAAAAGLVVPRLTAPSRGLQRPSWPPQPPRRRCAVVERCPAPAFCVPGAVLAPSVPGCDLRRYRQTCPRTLRSGRCRARLVLADARSRPARARRFPSAVGSAFVRGPPPTPGGSSAIGCPWSYSCSSFPGVRALSWVMAPCQGDRPRSPARSRVSAPPRVRNPLTPSRAVGSMPATRSRREADRPTSGPTPALDPPPRTAKPGPPAPGSAVRAAPQTLRPRPGCAGRPLRLGRFQRPRPPWPGPLNLLFSSRPRPLPAAPQSLRRDTLG
jgi:hypothetical protein